MTEQTINHNEGDEISLLDIVLILAESWRLLIFGPLVAAVLAGALSFLWSKSFESTAIVRLTETELALLGTPAVLDPLIMKFDLLPQFDGSLDDTRVFLAKKITGKFDKKAGLASISVVATTPEISQSMCSTAVDILLMELLPKGKNKDHLEQAIRSNEVVIANNIDTVDQLKRQMTKSGQGDAALEVVMKYYSSLTADIARRELENIEFRKSLTPKGAEVFVSQPTLPQSKVSPKRSLFVLLALLVSGFILLMFVFIRKAWRSAMQDKEAAAKITQIKLALTKKNGHL